MLPALDIRLFGPMSVMLHGEPLPRLRSRSAYWLLALLALRQGREVSREWLATELWPDSAPDLSLYNLRRCLTDVRHALGVDADALLVPTRSAIVLRENGVSVDVGRFRKAVSSRQEEALEEAVALYRGPLLEGCVEGWAVMERDVCAGSYLAALESLVEMAAARDDAPGAIRLLRIAIAADPLQEHLHRRLMEMLANHGDHAAADAVYRHLCQLLHRDLNARPSPETDALYQRIRQQERQPSPLAAPRKPAEGPSQRLPVPLTRLVGREREVDEVGNLLRSRRLVTLTGTGGVGKTRLAIAVGEATLRLYSGGVWFVDLSTITDPEFVAGAIARHLRIPEPPNQEPLHVLRAALADRSLLLILDNCEHLQEACARTVQGLVSACDGLRVLTTSRHALGITGECLYPVRPLTVPPLSESFTPKDVVELAEYAAIRLFVERVLLVKPEFRLTVDNSRAVCQICHRLDGLPLAIELAVARMRSLTVEEVESRLSGRFGLLTGGGRTAPARHQTLRKLIDWSYDLLDRDEQALLRRLSVFAGEWTLDAAERVCGDGVTSIDDLLASLIDKSQVVHREHGGLSLYGMLHSIREYGAERLVASGEDAAIRTRHRDYYRSLAEDAVPRLNGADQTVWLNRLEAEQPNFRAALAWCREASDGAVDELRITAALGRFWVLRGFLREGKAHLEAALQRTEAVGATRERAEVLYLCGAIDARVGKDPWQRFQEGLAIYRALDHRPGIANVLNSMGLQAAGNSDFVRGYDYLSESLGIQRDLGNEAGVATVLNSLGLNAWYRGDYATAKRCHEESLTIKRRLGNRIGIGFSLNNLGMVSLSQGDLEEARQHLEACLALREEVGDRWGIGDTLNYLGLVAWCAGDLHGARAHHERSLAMEKELGNRAGMANSLQNLGLVTARQGDLAAGLALIQAGIAIHEEVGDRLGVCRCLEAASDVVARMGLSERSERFWNAAAHQRRESGAPLPSAILAAYGRSGAEPPESPPRLADTVAELLALG